MRMAHQPQHQQHQQQHQQHQHDQHQQQQQPPHAGSDDWRQLAGELAAALRPAGLDIVHAFPLQLLDAACSPGQPLPTFGRPSTLALLIGNSAALWRPFVADLQRQQHAAANPLDAYVESAIRSAVARCCDDGGGGRRVVAHALRLSVDAGPRFVDMLRAARLAGLAFVSPAAHLALHPTYGPWFALRALLVVDAAGPCPSGLSQLPCPEPELEAEAARAVQQLMSVGGVASWQAHWERWAELRALIGRGTDPRHAYCEDQLRYHYTKDPAVLSRAIAQLDEQESGCNGQLNMGA